jgi:organic radical activating enzyme
MTSELSATVELPPSDKGFADGLLADLVGALKQVPEGQLLAFTTNQDISEELFRWSQLTENAIIASSGRQGQTRWVVRHGPAPAQGEDRPVGSRIWLYTNYHCNLACSYCCVRSSPRAPRRELGLWRVQRIVTEARELGVREIFVTGGEPFLLEEIDQILLACAATAPTVVLTNGMLFQGRQFEKLRVLPRERLALQISVDSPTPELHDLNRGRGSWSKAMQGIQIARREGFRVRFAATIATDEAEASFVRFLDSEGVAPEDRILRRIALRGFAEQGIAVARADLWPEPTFTAEGVYWHPVGADDGDLLVGPDLFPIRQVFERVRQLYEEQRRVHAQAASVFHCA